MELDLILLMFAVVCFVAGLVFIIRTTRKTGDMVVDIEATIADLPPWKAIPSHGDPAVFSSTGLHNAPENIVTNCTFNKKKEEVIPVEERPQEFTGIRAIQL